MRWHCVLLLLQFISAVQCYVYSSVHIPRTARTRRSALDCKHEPAELSARTRRSALDCKHEPDVVTVGKPSASSDVVTVGKPSASSDVVTVGKPSVSSDVVVAILEPASAAAPTATAPASGSAAASVADVQGRRGAARESLPLRLDGEWYDLDAWRPLIASDCL
jgi:hypothetical protein